MLERNYPTINLKKGREMSLKRGHPWVFSGSLGKITGKPKAGDVVLACNYLHEPLAWAFFNPRTDIALRILTTDCTRPPDDDFWRKLIRKALRLRQRIIGEKTNAYRLINAEGDGFPGLVVDVYDSDMVVCITTAGMEKQKKTIIDTLVKLLNPNRIYELSTGRSRLLEGLEEKKGFIYGGEKTDLTLIQENGHQFLVDIVNGQKTGFFLDQRVNREKLGAFSRNADILNCFSYTGAFSVYCCAGGAKRVVSLDVSKTACLAAGEHLRLNGFSSERHPVIAEDAFAYLRSVGEDYDLIILDPPAFAKTRRDVAGAARGYKEINLQAVRHLTEDGLLATFSCSNFIEEDLFRKIVLGAAQDAGISLQLLARLEAGPDHPLALGHPEGRYLKGLLLRRNG